MSNKNFMHEVAKKAFLNIEEEKPNAKEITALVKKKNKVVGYEVAGEFVAKDEAINMANQGMLKGVGVAKRNDTVYLKSIPDSNEDNNLGNLPTKSTKSSK